MKHSMQHIILGLCATITIIALSSCEDPVAFDYIPEYAVEAYLLVDQPFTDIMITKSQPVADSFIYENSIVKNAKVQIIQNQQDTLTLQFVDSERGGEYILGGKDSQKTVQPKTRYDLLVTLPDGKRITGTTFTPDRLTWITPPKSVLQYPTDTINLVAPDSLSISWTPLPGIPEYLIAITCEDTLGYGQYLSPQTADSNRKIYRFFRRNADNPRLRNLTLYGFFQGSKAPVVWTAFRWYGKHKLSIIAPDQNFLKWFKAGWGGNQYDYRLASVQGGLGVFASGSYVEQETFLLKNQ